MGVGYRLYELMVFIVQKNTYEKVQWGPLQNFGLMRLLKDMPPELIITKAITI